MVKAYEFDSAARKGSLKGTEGVDSGLTPSLGLGEWETELCPHTISEYSLDETTVTDGPEEDVLYYYKCEQCGKEVVTWSPQSCFC